jgi:hypothetical protein
MLGNGLRGPGGLRDRYLIMYVRGGLKEGRAGVLPLFAPVMRMTLGKDMVELG